MKKLYLASDHAGFEDKQREMRNLAEWLAERGELGTAWEIVDCGAFEYDPQDDYPDYIKNLGEQLQVDVLGEGIESKGIIFCKTGTGVTIAANKYLGLRAGNCFSVEHAKLAIEHNHIQIMAIPSLLVRDEEKMEIIKAFLTTAVDNDARHIRRLEKIKEIEKSQAV